MSTVTAKEKNMLVVIVVLVLYSVAALCYRKQETEWKNSVKSLKNSQKKYDEECALIAAKDEWDDKYRTMCALMPVFPYDKDVDTHWLNIMDTVASEHKLSISRRQTGKEEEVGDVYELPIDCKNWEGSLESLVGFLYGLRQEGAMLDVRQLFVRPGTQPGYLKGTFSLYCAYMRGDVIEESSDPTKVKIPISPPVAPPSTTDTASEKSLTAPAVEPAVPVEDAIAMPAEEKIVDQTKPRGTNENKPQPDVDEKEAVNAALEALKAAK